MQGASSVAPSHAVRAQVDVLTVAMSVAGQLAWGTSRRRLHARPDRVKHRCAGMGTAQTYVLYTVSLFPMPLTFASRGQIMGDTR